jgi:hypothetical protein
MKLRLTNRRFLFRRPTMLGRRNCLQKIKSLIVFRLKLYQIIETFIYLNPLYYFLLLWSLVCLHPEPELNSLLQCLHLVPPGMLHNRAWHWLAQDVNYGLLPVEPYTHLLQYDGRHVVLRFVSCRSKSSLRPARGKWLVQYSQCDRHRLQLRLNPGDAVQWCKIQHPASRIQNQHRGYYNYPIDLPFIISKTSSWFCSLEASPELQWMQRLWCKTLHVHSNIYVILNTQGLWSLHQSSGITLPCGEPSPECNPCSRW